MDKLWPHLRPLIKSGHTVPTAASKSELLGCENITVSIIWLLRYKRRTTNVIDDKLFVNQLVEIIIHKNYGTQGNAASKMGDTGYVLVSASSVLLPKIYSQKCHDIVQDRGISGIILNNGVWWPKHFWKSLLTKGTSLTLLQVLGWPGTVWCQDICWHCDDKFQVKHMGLGAFKNAYELLNLRALKISMLYKNRIFQCMGMIFCVEFQRYPLKFHSKYLTHTLKDVYFIRSWKFKSS